MYDMENHTTSLANEVADLRTDLAVLLEAIARLNEVQLPILTARYLFALGELEHRLMALQIEVLAMRRRIEMVQARLNRGERMSLADVAEIATELLAWRNTLQQKEQGIALAGLVLSGLTAVSVADAQRVKSAYRKLARLLHPDVSPENVALFNTHWSNVQQAYRAMDADFLEAILHLVERDIGQPLIGELAESIERLRSLVEEQARRLAQLQASPPFCYETLLNDEAWLAAKQTELEQDILHEAERLAVLVSRYAEIKSSMGELS